MVTQFLAMIRIGHNLGQGGQFREFCTQDHDTAASRLVVHCGNSGRMRALGSAARAEPPRTPFRDNFRVADDPGVIAPSRRQEKSGHPGGVYWIRVRHPILHLLFYKVVENNVAGNCVDGLDLPPLTEDHKIQVRIRGRDESTRAVRIYGVGARNIHWRD